MHILLVEAGPGAVDICRVEASTEADGGGDMWHVVGKSGRVAVGGGGGLSAQAAISPTVDKVRENRRISI